MVSIHDRFSSARLGKQQLKRVSRWIVAAVMVVAVLATEGLLTAHGPLSARGLLSAEASAPQGAPMVEMVGQLGGATYAVTAERRHAYLGDGPSLAVVEISNPEHPVLFGRAPWVPGVVRDIVLVGNHVLRRSQSRSMARSDWITFLAPSGKMGRRNCKLAGALGSVDRRAKDSGCVSAGRGSTAG